MGGPQPFDGLCGRAAGIAFDLGKYAPRLAVLAAVVALATAVAALAASVGTLAAGLQGQLPAGLTFVAFVVALLGFVGTGLLVSVAALRTDALPGRLAGGLLVAATLTLAAPVAASATGTVPVLLLMALLAAWAFTLVALGRAVPRAA